MNKILVFVSSVLVTLGCNAEERVYTTVDAQGRVQIIKSEMPKKEDKEKESSTEKKAPINNSSVIQETPQLEGEQYIDSESFEKQLSAKKKPNRFYYVPSGAIGEKVVESNENLATTPASKRDFQPQKIIDFSTNYQLLVKDDLSLFKQDILEYCGKPKLLKKARLFKDTNALWIESVDFVKNEPDKMLVIGEPVTKQQFFRLASYATSQKKPKFYLPIVVFFDEQACVLSGAWQYWSQATPATNNQFGFVEGLLQVPEKTKYVLLYTPDKRFKPDLPSQNYGSLLIEKIKEQ